MFDCVRTRFAYTALPAFIICLLAVPIILLDLPDFVLRILPAIIVILCIWLTTIAYHYYSPPAAPSAPPTRYIIETIIGGIVRYKCAATARAYETTITEAAKNDDLLDRLSWEDLILIAEACARIA